MQDFDHRLYEAFVAGFMLSNRTHNGSQVHQDLSHPTKEYKLRDILLPEFSAWLNDTNDYTPSPVEPLELAGGPKTFYGDTHA